MTGAVPREENPCRPRHFRPDPCGPAAPPETPARQSLDQSHTRLLITAALFCIAFAVIGARLVLVTLDGDGPFVAQGGPTHNPSLRADIVDRNGVLLATTLETPSLFADPKEIGDPHAAAAALKSVLPDLDAKDVEDRLASAKSFVWLRRHLSPREEAAINRLGLPGLHFMPEGKRVYPEGDLAAHVVGYSDTDGNGLAGVERGLDQRLKAGGAPVTLALDARIQYILRDETAKAVSEFDAVGGMGIVMDVRTGEVLAMVSLPDFDPNDSATATTATTFDRDTLGVYEMGSVFKIFNTAMALDSGKITLADSFDANPIHIGRFTIHDFEPMNHPLTVPQIFMYSSNIGAAHMAVEVGTDYQKAFMARIGMLRPAGLEIPELGRPLYPVDWRQINTMTIAYGQGIAVSPLHVASGVAAMINGGLMRPATLIKRAPDEVSDGERVVSADTSTKMRELLRLVVQAGTGKFADVPGYLVGGKTGTAQKQLGRGYEANARLASFVGAFPMSAPRYVVLCMVDEPKPDAQSHGYATGGWVAAPVVARVIARMAPLVGLPPIPDDSPEAKNELLTQVSLTANAAE
jgi:cell division protein FtsI (penicillin-binding protein 3)